MSFRLFVYYSALCGGCAAYIGWLVGWLAVGSGSDANLTLDMGIVGLWLGVLVALGLGLVDAVWNVPLRQVGQVGLRVSMAVALGGLGGLVGGLMGQALVSWSGAFKVLGWTITGLLIGASLGAYDIVSVLMSAQDTRSARGKVWKGAIGGTVGGLLGGILFVWLATAWAHIFEGKAIQTLWSPRATGFVALGLCIGLAIGLAQVILKEAWIKVEQGFRSGRQMILSKAETTIGRAESCDIGLFGDQSVQPLHARILSQGAGYVLFDAGTPSGTFVNGQKCAPSAPLRSGDVIQVGDSVLRFNERARRETAEK